MRVFPATVARNRFFEILNTVIFSGEDVVVEKEGAGRVRIIPDQPKRSPLEIAKVLLEVRRVFAVSKKRRYWSVIETPAWKKKEEKYLNDLVKRVT